MFASRPHPPFLHSRITKAIALTMTALVVIITASTQWKTQRISVPDTQVSDHRPVVSDLMLS